jgi:hypothetical protein
MPINKSNIIFIGNAGGICGYLSHGINIIRKSSSLTCKRVEQEPAFEGFRKSGNRMRQASPIAASLYKLLSKEQKEYSLYRRLTGEVLMMIKQGIEVELIVARLKEQYIDPIIKSFESKSHIRKDQTNSGRSKNHRKTFLLGGDLFKTFPKSRSDKRHVRLKPILQYPDGRSNTANLIEDQDLDEDIFRKLPDNIPVPQTTMTPRQKRLLQFSAFIYMGRHVECKGLKMWLRPCQ